MNLFMIPERIRIVVGLDAETRALLDRALDIVEGKPQAQIDALTARLKASRIRTAEGLGANPDPNPTD